MKKLEAETLKPNFWQNAEGAAQTQKEIFEIREEIESIENFEKELKDVEVLANESLAEELIKKIEKEISAHEFRIFLSGKYDRNNAILEIFSGAGGQDAQDWATMLLRMYERYCAAKGFKTQILHQSFGQALGPEGRIGTKSATVEIKGNYAYGMLKKESGAHRLVRISPFNAQKLRQTSFALVNILPELEENNSEITIRPEELKIDTFRASGPGGQYVNKTESAVRITHIPTGIVVTSQTERLQGKNKDNAIKILLAKLYQLKQESEKKELKKIKFAQGGPAPGGGVASWGNQIRSYVLHPYKMVKDLRTQYETSDPESVLDGDLENFIEAELKLSF